MPSTTKRRQVIGQTIPLAGIVGAAALLWLALGPDAQVHLDTARDLLLARDCVDGFGCHRAGAFTSFGGTIQGALWVDVLALALWLKLSLGTVRLLVVVLHALATSTVFFLACRFLSKTGALLAAAF